MENIRTVRTVYGKSKPTARHGRIKAQPFKKRTAPNRGNGFLNHSFSPFWLFLGNPQRAETEYFRSLQQLCSYYDLIMPDVSAVAFPQNVYKSWQIVCERIKAIDKNLDCIILQNEQNEAVLATTSHYDTGRTLYYLPVKPVWQWVSAKEQQPAAEIILTIFAYLYQVVQFPFYADCNTFLYEQYQYIEDMINDEMCDDDKEEQPYREEQLDEIFKLKNSGIHMSRLMNEKERLTKMDDTVLNYANVEERDNDLAILAIEFAQLYKAYPQRSIYDTIRPDLYYPEIRERIAIDEYVGFYWSGEDCVIETVMEMIDCTFQERSITDEPTHITLFDRPETEKTESFGFESRLFPLLDRLCTFLHQYDK